MLMQIDGTFLFVIVSFLIFLTIIKSILFNPITKVMEEREKFYEKNSKMELDSKEKAKVLIDEKDALLAKSKLDASNIIKEASKSAKEQSALKIKQTKTTIQEEIEKNNQKLDEEKKNAKLEIKDEVNTIVESIISKVLNEDIKINLSEEKVKKYLNI